MATILAGSGIVVLAASLYPADASGVILTGMGKDGAIGLKEMRAAGSPTIAQDEATSVVWGMPGEAVAIGAAVETLALQTVSARILALAESMDLTRER